MTIEVTTSTLRSLAWPVSIGGEYEAPRRPDELTILMARYSRELVR